MFRNHTWGPGGPFHSIRRNSFHSIPQHASDPAGNDRCIRRSLCRGGANPIVQMDPLFGPREVPESAFCSSWEVEGEYRGYSVVPGVFSPKEGIDVGATPRVAASSKGNDMGFISNDSGNIQGSRPGLHSVAPPELQQATKDVSDIPPPHPETPHTGCTADPVFGGLRRGHPLHSHGRGGDLSWDNFGRCNPPQQTNPDTLQTSLPELQPHARSIDCGSRNKGVGCGGQSASPVVDIPTSNRGQRDVSLQLLRQQYPQTEESLWERLLVLERVSEVTNAQLYSLWGHEIVERFSLHLFPTTRFYEYGDSIVCRCVEGYFRFTPDMDFARLLTRSDVGKVFLLLSGAARVDDAPVLWEGRVYTREELREVDYHTLFRVLSEGEELQAIMPEGEWRAAGRPYDPFGENEIGP